MTDDDSKRDFLAKAAEPSNESLAAEFWSFLKENRKWWLLPIIVAILALGVLIMLGGGAAGPFVYTLF